jgi:hypothetical protein
MQIAGDKECDETGIDWRDMNLALLARAAIEAMREPTEAMIVGHHEPTAKVLWACMIDAALK